VLVVADINTLWRSRPFEALAELIPVLGLAPEDRLVSLRSGRRPWGRERSVRGRMETLRVVMPFRWASRRAESALPQLWKAAQRRAADLGQKVRGLVVTSPHYLSLCRQLNGSLPIFYYCSDDYRSYASWGAKEIAEAERNLVRLARHSFFVSEELRLRAVSEYGAVEASTSVSMNATEELFLQRVPEQQLEALMKSHPHLRRPLVGVVGGINERLDFELLAQVSQLPEVGSLMFVGPVASESLESVGSLVASSDKVVMLGSKPHGELAAWQQLLDVALIPYRATDFNRYCSPMRLFDHMAAGRPIVATSACSQVSAFQTSVKVADGECFLRHVEESLVSSKDALQPVTSETWSARASRLHRHLASHLKD
jgi:glycosyltransferase involved in cell wall biosynthesis